MTDELAHSELLQSIVETARAIFAAKAASITLYDESADELVFRASAGEGSAGLVGMRFPASHGIAGFVLRSREPLVIEDVSHDPRFARDVAEATGYVPRGLMAIPLIRGERALGVLQVLDRPADVRFTLAEMELLGLFGRQAAIALDVVESATSAPRVLEDEPEASAVAQLASAVNKLTGKRRAAAIALMQALEELLDTDDDLLF
jgi:GAF domain-containing protein